MTGIEWLLSLAVLIGAGFWIRGAIRCLKVWWWVEKLSDQRPPPPASWPKVSVIVAACNEAETLGPAMETFLALDYPALEIVVVDDRSTDGTGAIVDALGERDARIVPVHVRELPEGWLGKVHALKTAEAHASGEWLLFADADVHVEQRALQKAVACAIADKLDHLAIVPFIVARGFWVKVIVGAFLFSLFAQLPLAEVGRSQPGFAFGIGAFNLVRRRKLAESLGLEWLRMEVLDDIGLALLIVRAGGKSRALFGVGDVSIVWWPSFTAAVRSFDKNAFTSARYSYGFATAALMLIAFIVVAPFLGALPATPPAAGIAGIAAVAILSIVAVFPLGRAVSGPWISATLILGQVVVAVFVVRAAYLCWRQGGIAWRGTVYPLARLREGRRVHWPDVR